MSTASSAASSDASTFTTSSAVSTASTVTSATSSAAQTTTSPSSSSSATSTTTVSNTTPTTTTTTVRPTTSSTSSSITSPTTFTTTSASVSSNNGGTVTTVITSTFTPTSSSGGAATTSSSGTSSSTTGSSSTPLSNTGDSTTNSSGLSTGGVTAIAVVVPIVVVALLLIAGILLWRKRKAKKAAEDARRKEVEDYGYNPNNDPTLPSVASDGGLEMTEDHSSGYRGWGAATTASRKMSTTLSGGGHTQGQLSDAGSNMYGPPTTIGSPNPQYASADAHSGDPLVGGGSSVNNPRRETMNSDEMASLGLGPAVAPNALPRRGPSNASSTYSHAAAQSDTSTDDHLRPDLPIGQAYDYSNPSAAANGYGYSQHGPYGDGTYGGSGGPDAAGGGMPVVRDVSARRNTRIQQPGNYQQGNSGISQNF